ncbi:hypothetical protein [Methanopyrus kandleri]
MERGARPKIRTHDVTVEELASEIDVDTGDAFVGLVTLYAAPNLECHREVLDATSEGSTLIAEMATLRSSALTLMVAEPWDRYPGVETAILEEALESTDRVVREAWVRIRSELEEAPMGELLSWAWEVVSCGHEPLRVQTSRDALVLPPAVPISLHLSLPLRRELVPEGLTGLTVELSVGPMSSREYPVLWGDTGEISRFLSKPHLITAEVRTIGCPEDGSVRSAR